MDDPENRQDVPPDAVYDQGEPPVIPPGPGTVSRISERTTERVVERTCAWCGTPIAIGRRGGRPRRYCTRSHRQRDYELRTALARRERDRQAGTARAADEPVREVVERTRVRTVVRTVRAPAEEGGADTGDRGGQRGQAPPDINNNKNNKN